MTITEINARLAAIRTEMDNEGADLDALEKEARGLLAEKDKLEKQAQTRGRILTAIGGGQGSVIRCGGEEPEALTPEQIRESDEYRKAYLTSLMGKPLTDQQRTVITTGSGSAGMAMATTTANKIMSLVKEMVPFVNDITLLSVNGNVRFAVESTRTKGAKHTQGAAIDAEDIALTEITLGAYEITKLVQISQSVATMTIDAFESWLVDMLAQSIADRINYVILFGTGTGEGKGVDKAITWTDGTNQVKVGKTDALSVNNVLALVGMLDGKYDRTAKFIMSKRTLITDFVPLMDKNKNNVVTQEGKNYYVQGYPVIVEDSVPLHDAYLGSLKAVIGNMPQAATIKHGFDLDTNSEKYLGAAMFDCTISDTKAFVKLTKAAS